MSLRPKPHELVPVEDAEIIVRFVKPNDYKADLAEGQRIQASAMPTNDFTPSDKSYGASVWVPSRLSNGLEDLYAEDDRWRKCLRATVPVAAIRELQIDVRYTPQDSQYESLKNAHASLLNVDRPKRNKLIRVLEKYLLAA